MAKVSLVTLANMDNPSGFIEALNQNFQAISTAMDVTLSRNSTAPNAIQANIDVNGYRIINLPEPITESEPARAGDLLVFTNRAEAAAVAAEAAQGAAEESAEDLASAVQAAENSANLADSRADAALVSENNAEAAAALANHFDIIMYAGGLLGNSEIIFRFVAARTFILPVGLSGSRIVSRVAAGASHVLTLKKNGSDIGTATFASAGTTATFSFASAVSFAAGDIFSVDAPATADGTQADFSFSFVATRT